MVSMNSEIFFSSSLGESNRNPSFDQLIQIFNAGMIGLTKKYGLHLDEVVNEGWIVFVTTQKSFNPQKGSFSKRWWFLLQKEIAVLAISSRDDALAYRISAEDEFFDSIAMEENEARLSEIEIPEEFQELIEAASEGTSGLAMYWGCSRRRAQQRLKMLVDESKCKQGSLIFSHHSDNQL
jgi:hypothetical protein